MIVYETDSLGFATGASREIGDGDPVPFGWTNAEPPAAANGLEPMWFAGSWAMTSRAAVVQASARPAAQIQEEIVAATQRRLDDFAMAVVVDAQGRVHGDYDGVNSASKYANLTDAQIAAMPADTQAMVAMFRTDCQYLAAVTAQTWATLYAIQAQVQAGNWPTTGAGQAPSGFADIEPSLPALGWPA